MQGAWAVCHKHSLEMGREMKNCWKASDTPFWRHKMPRSKANRKTDEQATWPAARCPHGNTARSLCIAEPDDGHAISDRQHNLLQLGVVADPLVKFTNRIPKVAAGRLRVEVLVHVGVAVVEDVVADNYSTRRKEVPLQKHLDVAVVLRLVGINKDEVKLPGELGQGVQSGPNHNLVALRNLWEAAEAIREPALQKGINLERDHTRCRSTLKHRHRAVAHKHANLKHAAGHGHEGELLQEHRLERVRGHLLAVGEHGPLRRPLLRPVRGKHLRAHRAHRRALGPGLRDAVGILQAHDLRELCHEALYTARKHAPLRACGQACRVGLLGGRSPLAIRRRHRWRGVRCLRAIEAAHIGTAVSSCCRWRGLRRRLLR
mmetsp:Transcript_15786/g.42948  ORF Transcript_15786/g.42948 Transcript_15786/m.42948 type:complete len:374 (+) Transcript_15786:91-1212(+)